MEEAIEMTSDQITHLRRLIETHKLNADPLVVVRTDDLTALLDCYEWNTVEKPRVRRRARLTEPELAE